MRININRRAGGSWPPKSYLRRAGVPETGFLQKGRKEVIHLENFETQWRGRRVMRRSTRSCFRPWGLWEAAGVQVRRETNVSRVDAKKKEKKNSIKEVGRALNTPDASELTSDSFHVPSRMCKKFEKKNTRVTQDSQVYFIQIDTTGFGKKRYGGHLRVCTLTRGSPFSCRLRSFSWRLLDATGTASCSALAGVELRPKTKGEMTDVHSLKTAYMGIWNAEGQTSTWRCDWIDDIRRGRATRTSHPANRYQSGKPLVDDAARSVRCSPSKQAKRTGNIEDVEAPFCNAGLTQVFAVGYQSAGLRVAPCRADFDQVVGQEESREVGQDIEREDTFRGGERASLEKEAQDEGDEDGNEEAEAELLHSAFVLVCCSAEGFNEAIPQKEAVRTYQFVWQKRWPWLGNVQHAGTRW